MFGWSVHGDAHHGPRWPSNYVSCVMVFRISKGVGASMFCSIWSMSSCQLRGPDGQTARHSLCYIPRSTLYLSLPPILHLPHSSYISVGCPHLLPLLWLLWLSSSSYFLSPSPISLKRSAHSDHRFLLSLVEYSLADRPGKKSIVPFVNENFRSI